MMLRTVLVATLLAGVLLSLPFSGCTATRPAGSEAPGSEEPGPVTDATHEALADARARWQAAGLDGYRFVYEASCFCPEEVRGPFTITVRAGVVQEVRFQGQVVVPDAQRHPTVAALFATLADALGQDPDAARIRYDDALGYPTEAYVDYE